MKTYRRNSTFKRRRRTYVPQGLRVPSRRLPYASKYGDECFVKVQKVVPLATQNANGDVYFFQRADLSASTATDFALADQPEFVPFLALFGFYEVRGMKAEMTCADAARVTGSGLYAGQAPNIVNTASAGAPTNDDLVKFPLQQKGNTQGQEFSLYYDVRNELLKQNAQVALPSNRIFSDTANPILVGRMQLSAAPTTGTLVGEVKLTWYVRLTSRKAF